MCVVSCNGSPSFGIISNNSTQYCHVFCNGSSFIGIMFIIVMSPVTVLLCCQRSLSTAWLASYVASFITPSFFACLNTNVFTLP